MRCVKSACRFLFRWLPGSGTKGDNHPCDVLTFRHPDTKLIFKDFVLQETVNDITQKARYCRAFF